MAQRRAGLLSRDAGGAVMTEPFRLKDIPHRKILDPYLSEAVHPVLYFQLENFRPGGTHESSCRH